MIFDDMWGYLVQCTTLILIKLLIKRHIQSQKPLWKQCRWQWPRFGRVWMPRAATVDTWFEAALGITKGVQSFCLRRNVINGLFWKPFNFHTKTYISLFQNFHGFSSGLPSFPMLFTWKFESLRLIEIIKCSKLKTGQTRWWSSTMAMGLSTSIHAYLILLLD